MENRASFRGGEDQGPIYPFRWDISKRNQLGRLVEEQSADPAVWWQNMYPHTWWYSFYSYEWFLNQIASCAARVIAFCADSDLCFVGRSPESLFDHLSGLLFDTSWAGRLTLLHFSMRGNKNEVALEEYYPGALSELKKYMTSLGLNPESVAQRERTIALVDIVARGYTFGNLIAILHDWCKQLNFDWGAVQRKIRVVGLTEQTETSPKTWRWQQHAEWKDMLKSGAIKNVSIHSDLFHFLGGSQPKMTRSYSPNEWGDPEVKAPVYNEESLSALKMALELFDAGRQSDNRLKFATELSKQPAMQHRWFRALIQELKGQ